MSYPIRKTLIALTLSLAIPLSTSAPAAETVARKPYTQAIYVLKNPKGANKIGLFVQNPYDGTITYSGEYDTGGSGDKNLQDHQSHALVVKGKHLFVTNAGDDSITVFTIGVRGLLTNLGHFDSGGDHPVSLALKGDQLIVLNQGQQGSKTGDALGTQGNIRVFRILASGALKPIKNARYDFSPDDVPVEVLSTENDGFISVARLGSNAIDNFWFDTTNGRIIKTDSLVDVNAPLGGAMNPNKRVSVYTLSNAELPGVISMKMDADGKNISQYQDIQPELLDPSWAAIHPAGHWFWLSSFQNREISLYRLSQKGIIKPVSTYIPVADAGGGRDIEVDSKGKYLFRLRALPVKGKTAPRPVLDAFRIAMKNETAGLRWIGSAQLPEDWAKGSPTGIAIARVKTH